MATVYSDGSDSHFGALTSPRAAHVTDGAHPISDARHDRSEARLDALEAIKATDDAQAQAGTDDTGDSDSG